MQKTGLLKHGISALTHQFRVSRLVQIFGDLFESTSTNKTIQNVCKLRERYVLASHDLKEVSERKQEGSPTLHTALL